MRPAHARTSPNRRGVTLLEMLVAVALLVLMMSILVAVFRSATGAITVSRSYAEMDQNLRRLNMIINQDLSGLTAKFGRPIDPAEGLGYFEYGENQLSDYQGEDTDDYLAFTAHAQPGRPFTGRMCIANGNFTAATQYQFQQIVVTSDTAEIIYFLRNGNLYRRVLLVQPQAQLTIGFDPGGSGKMNPGGGFYTAQFDGNLRLVSWQGMNDISAHPSGFGATVASYVPVPNTLSSLTERHNRFGKPRFANDYMTYDPTSGSYFVSPDGLPDDQNFNTIDDYYPSLYPNAMGATATHAATGTSYPLLNDPDTSGNFGTGATWRVPTPTLDTMAFPYVFVGAFSKGYNPVNASDRAAAFHFLAPQGSIIGTGVPAAPPYRPNHAPLEIGDNLQIPTDPAQHYQTWWGYPTWRETLSRFWTDPVKRINDPAQYTVAGSTLPTPYYNPAPLLAPNSGPSLHPNDTIYTQAPGLSWIKTVLLPPLNGTAFADDIQPFSDGVGSPAFVAIPDFPATTNYNESESVYQDDLIMSGVRSFNVKAYDEVSQSYEDLGYGDLDNQNVAPTAVDYRSFRHEGHMPPYTRDGVVDPHYNDTNNPSLPLNLGNNAVGTVRLARVYDTWSTTYSNANKQPISSTGLPTLTGRAYPSYPAPYPVGLRGIEIQIRVTDPTNRRAKTMTIHHDFSDRQY